MRTSFGACRFFLQSVLALNISVCAFAQTETLVTTISLQELLRLDITVASGNENRLNLRQSPGIVTVLTSRDIEAIGATNLFELLRNVAGYDIGVDAFHLESFMIRGNYGGEGQVLINIDGIPINETSYGSTIYAGNYFVDYIERIEIIRGPGSALYGGVAELSVINIISKELIDSTQVNIASNQLNNSVGYNTGSIATGFAIDANLDFAVNIFAGVSKRNDAEGGYYTSDGSYSDDASQLFGATSDYFRIRSTLEDFTFDFLYSELRQDYPLSNPHTDSSDDTPNSILGLPGTIKYASYITNLRYRHELFNYTTLSGSIFYGKYDSGQRLGDFVEQYAQEYWDVPTDRFKVEVAINERPFGIESVSLDLGYGYYLDSAEYSVQQVDLLQSLYNIGRKATTDAFGTHYLYAQALADYDDYIFTAGFRAERHNVFGGVTVSRLGLTRVMGPFHYKVLASSAYRAPSIGALGISEEVAPEETQVLEFETGLLIGSRHFLQANIFSNSIDDVIVYSDEIVDFINEGNIRTNGFELEYRYEPDWGFVALHFSHTQPKENTIIAYQAANYNSTTGSPEFVDKLLGATELKWGMYGQYRLTSNISINPSFVYVGERYTIGQIPELGIGSYTSIDPDLVANLYVQMNDVITSGLDASLGIYNLTDGYNTYPTGFVAGGKPTTNGIGRRIEIKLKFGF
jgi:outer membrane cobalamin receptor